MTTRDRYDLDGHKLIYHPERVAQWRAASDDWEKLKKVYPIYVEISPSGACNHRCTFCAMDYIGYRGRYLSLETISQRVPEMASLGLKSVLQGGEGEPLLNRNFARISIAIHRAGLDQALTTNAVLLSRDLVDETLDCFSWIKVSIAAGSPSTYAKIHQTKEGDFARVVENLRYAVAVRNLRNNRCTLGAQLLLLPENVHEVETLALICRDTIGLDYLVVKPHSQHPFSLNKRYSNLDYASLAANLDNLERLSTEDFQMIIRRNTMSRRNQRRAYSMCRATPFFWAHIQSNGDVYGCNAFLQRSEEFYLGNISEESFKDIWEGDRRRRCYEHIHCGLDIQKCRSNCRMNLINEYLDELAHPVEHVNFI